MKQLRLSGPGAEFVAAWEGYRARAYNDSDQPPNATIGIGHELHPGPVTAADRKLDWTYPEALKQLQEDARSNGLDMLERSLAVKISQKQIDALCSLGFNCGPGALAAGHAVMAAVNSKPARWNPAKMAGWHLRVRRAMLLWADPAVLRRRRLSEAWLFNIGRYRKPLNPYANA